jgi:serine/threonine-protein kinase RsbW
LQDNHSSERKGFSPLKILKNIYFQANSDLKALDRVLSNFNQLDGYWIPKIVWLQCQLALAEAFTNVVRHAHKKLSSEALISVEVTLLEKSIEIRVWDYGEPFNLEAFIQNYGDRQRRIDGGRGIMILHRIADYLNYVRTDDGRNCLLIVKTFEPEE